MKSSSSHPVGTSTSIAHHSDCGPGRHFQTRKVTKFQNVPSCLWLQNRVQSHPRTSSVACLATTGHATGKGVSDP
ncbi:hypothetical protein Cob_v011716 [Colletotrichum orbiculare MAFF 240422]|uniref:Uncharacterized protein n=1 Tax=Colletotrichum orbiculare (strain 104-T / ATCC 96160 / CBS 514.97 / LARS 414 / MAFF 240422) TaxID=1213857 RepID=A0A484FBR5_COLOR|nr:hypothetical protein Cob_v011716 [Colletotrichum orbiculare MAFF 240422]